MPNHPRVLFVTPHAFNGVTGSGITFTNLFRGWPKACLATVHNDPEPPSEEVCDHYYRITGRELDLIKPLAALKRRLRGQSDVSSKSAQSTYLPDVNSLRHRLRLRIVGDALPERSRLTTELQRWIVEYRPEVLYTILGSNGMMMLIERIRRQFALPLVVHIMDDWAASYHRNGLLGLLQRRRMERWVSHFFLVADVCLGISEVMCDAYQARYGRPFRAFQNTIEINRWARFAKRHLDASENAELLYVGSIFPNTQLHSLIDCVRAVKSLNAAGRRVRLRIASPRSHAERYRPLLEVSSDVHVEGPIGDDETFFRTIAETDILLLPVNFDEESIRFIRYSMPTKVPAYLTCGAPVLVYGPSATAQVRYALESSWGHVLDRRDPKGLESAICRLLDDVPLRRQLIQNARKAARENHDARIVRSAFQQTLCSVERKIVEKAQP